MMTGEMSFYYDADTALKQGAAWDSADPAIILRAGPNTVAQRMKINAPNARVDHQQDDYDYPEETAARMTLPFKAHQDAAAADESTIVFD